MVMGYPTFFSISETPSQQSQNNHLSPKLMAEVVYDFDIIVIGGGSGGVACAKQCADYGAKVALFDFVNPSPRGTKWGLGGTCVNVGCIPKKLMHRSATIGSDIQDAPFYGWTGVDPSAAKVDWNGLIDAVQNHVHKLNFSYRNELRSLGITYINASERIINAQQQSILLLRAEEDLRILIFPELRNAVLRLMISSLLILLLAKPFVWAPPTSHSSVLAC